MAAGSGSRMGAQMPKQFLEIDGKAVEFVQKDNSLTFAKQKIVITIKIN